MTKQTNKIFNSFLYATHFVLMALFAISPFVLDLWVVVVIYIGIELSLVAFDGCFMTIWQQNTGGLDEEQDFMKDISKRFFKYDLSDLQHELLSLLVLQGPLLLAALFYGF